MDIKPQNFFIGVIDFFSVLLPGALFTYFLKGLYYEQFFGKGKIFPEPTGETDEWIVFLMITYIMGNIIFLVGSFLLDNVYDKFLRKIFKKNYDLSLKTARALQNEYLPADELITRHYSESELSDDDFSEILKKNTRTIFNTFKWAQHFLLFKNPEALSDIKRIEADSKFFRSLVITFLAIGIILINRESFTIIIYWPIFFVLTTGQSFFASWLFFSLSVLCFYRFGELRYKSTERAYELIVTYEHLAKVEYNEDQKSNFLEKRLEKFLATENVYAEYKSKISMLTNGIKMKAKLYSIPTRSELGTVHADLKILYCLKGICTATSKQDKGQIFISPGAIVEPNAGTMLRIVNKGPEPVLLLFMK